MNYFRLNSIGVLGKRVDVIQVECVQQRRLPYLQIIGAPSQLLQEQRERVMAALESSGFRLPARRITVHLSGWSAGMSVECLDLPVALAILGSAKVIPAQQEIFACGSLGLDGRILPLHCRAPLREWLHAQTAATLLPWEDSHLLGERKKGGGFRFLAEVVAHLREKTEIGARQLVPTRVVEEKGEIFWRALAGRALAQRVAQLTAAGGHPIFLAGADPVESKAMAQAILALLPPMSAALAEESSSVHQIFGEKTSGQRPFRELRSDQAARYLRFDAKAGLWGEISLAHGGLLFLSDLGERPDLLAQKLQEPLECGAIRAFRGGQTYWQGADWLLVARLFPGPEESERYRQRIERIRPYFHLFYSFAENQEEEGKKFRAAAEEVAEARVVAEKRQGKCNGRLSIEECFRKVWQEDALGLWRLSRSGRRENAVSLARVALTVSDLRRGKEVSREDVLEARHYVPASFVEAGRRFWRGAMPERNSTAIP